MEIEVVRASSHYRKRFVMTWIVAAFVLAVCLCAFQFYLAHAVGQLGKNFSESNAQGITQNVQLFLWFISGLTLAAAGTLLRSSWHIWRNHQYPIPGAQVLFDTPVIFGRRAFIHSLVLLLLAIFFCAAAAISITLSLVL